MHKLFASKITNLTDARYFAAYMPTFMSLPLPGEAPDDLKDCKTMMSWIDGVQWLLELQSNQNPEPSVYTELEVEGIHYIGLESYDPNFIIHGIKVISLQESELDRVCADLSILGVFDELVLPPGTHSTDISKIAKALDKRPWIHLKDPGHWESLAPIYDGVEGILVEGYDEEKVGLKSFERIDQILEKVIF